jgi:hypothetical protein
MGGTLIMVIARIAMTTTISNKVSPFLLTTCHLLALEYFGSKRRYIATHSPKRFEGREKTMQLLHMRLYYNAKEAYDEEVLV